MYNLWKNKIFIAKKTKTYDQEKSVDKKVSIEKINNKNLVFKDYEDKNYVISIGPLKNLKEFDKIYLKLSKIGLIGFDIKVQ